MSGLDRYVAVLRLYGVEKSTWTVQEMADALGIPASTVYRTIRDLVAAGFLEPATEAHYRLGAAFVEFDRLIRLTDPLVRRGQSLLRDVATQARIPCVAILARLYGDTVMCVADDAGAAGAVRTSYERGLPMPLTRGATSKTILAQLPVRRLRRLLANDRGTDTSLAPPAEGLREQLGAIRKQGFCITRGEIDPGLVGLAAPVSVPELDILASLSVVAGASDLDDSHERRILLLLVSSATLLVEDLRRTGGDAHPAVRIVS
jgi:DNA-binding IclR family transcriptional regulator